MNAAFPKLSCKQGTKAIPPVPHRLVADVDATLEQNVFDLAQRQRIADIHHHGQPDDLGRGLEITEGIVHHRRLRDLTSRLKPIYSDNALAGNGDITERNFLKSQPPTMIGHSGTA